MADIPSEVAYGTVRWRPVAFTADSTDAGTIPDQIPLTGSVTIRPLVGRTRYPTLATPITAFLRTAICPIVNGWLCGPGATTPDVSMVSSFQVSADIHTVQYEATFNLDDLARADQPPALVFTIPAGGVIDLTTVLPQTPTPPITYVVDDTIRVAAEAAAAAAASSAASAAASVASIQAGIGPAVATYLAANPPTYGTLTMDSISDATATGKAVARATSAAAARTAIGAGTSSLTLGGTGVATTAMHSDWTPLSTDISDATATGKAVLVAASQAAARTAIGAGTSNLALGGTGSATTAMHSDWRPLSTDISDASTIGKQILVAADAAAVRTLIGAGTGSGTGGDSVHYVWNGTDYGTIPTTAPAGIKVRYFTGPSAPLSPPVWTGVATLLEYWAP